MVSNNDVNDIDTNNLNLALDELSKYICQYREVDNFFKKLQKKYPFKEISNRFFIYIALQKCLKSLDRRSNLKSFFPSFLLKNNLKQYIVPFCYDLICFPAYSQSLYNIYYGFLSRKGRTVELDRHEKDHNSDEAMQDLTSIMLNVIINNDELFDKFISKSIGFNASIYLSIDKYINHSLIYKLQHKRFINKYNRSLTMLYLYYTIMYKYLHKIGDDTLILDKLYKSKKSEYINTIVNILNDLNVIDEHKTKFEAKLSLMTIKTS